MKKNLYGIWDEGGATSSLWLGSGIWKTRKEQGF